MAGPIGPRKNPAVAGKFYPADASECRALAQGYVDAGANKFGATCTNVTNGTRAHSGTPSGVLRGGIVPHAGWICSGAIAGETIGALKTALPDADLIVVFGAIHTPIPIDRAALDSYATWIEPSGESLVTEAVRKGLAEKSDVVCRGRSFSSPRTRGRSRVAADRNRLAGCCDFAGGSAAGE